MTKQGLAKCPHCNSNSLVPDAAIIFSENSFMTVDETDLSAEPKILKDRTKNPSKLGLGFRVRLQCDNCKMQPILIIGASEDGTQIKVVKSPTDKAIAQQIDLNRGFNRGIAS